VNCAGVIQTAIENNWMIQNIRAGKLSFEKFIEMTNDLLTNMNLMNIYFVAGIVFYVLTLLLIKSISKDIEKDTNKPKYRWTKLDKQSPSN
jgi:hypothetical protein